MLSRDRRLNKADFETAFTKGRQFRHPLLVLRCYQREDGDRDQLRAAFAVPKKLAKATGRNRWRRRLRHWFYEILQLLPESNQDNAAKWNQCDLIFMLTAQGQEAKPREVQQAMQVLWKRRWVILATANPPAINPVLSAPYFGAHAAKLPVYP